MVNLKKYNGFLKLFVIFLTLTLIVSCSKHNYYVRKIEGRQIKISDSNNIKDINLNQIENYIKPFREHINHDLDSTLAYSPETQDKSNGKWQTSIGNLMADVSLKFGNTIFQTRENKKIDLCILNNGGIRAILPKGNITSRTAFEIMPFENSMVVIALKGDQILEMVTYFIASKKPHPISGITFTIGKDYIAKNILINNQAIEIEKIYYVGTNDYLANGGDNMIFFKKGIQRFDLNYKLRNILIDYFKEVDTIPVIKDVRVNVE
jgi:2',3'-cyclic-nucleotide 2'-phosphodiesterase (5'-nucleotidase family)